MEQKIFTAFEQWIPGPIWVGAVLILLFILGKLINWVLAKLYKDFMGNLDDLHKRIAGLSEQVGNQNNSINEIKARLGALVTIEHHNETAKNMRNDIESLKRKVWHIENNTMMPRRKDEDDE